MFRSKLYFQILLIIFYPFCPSELFTDDSNTKYSPTCFMIVGYQSALCLRDTSMHISFKSSFAGCGFPGGPSSL